MKSRSFCAAYDSVKFSVPAGRGIYDNRHCDCCFSISNFWSFCLFPAIVFDFMSIRSEIDPKKNDGNCFTWRFTNSKVKGNAPSEEIDRLEIVFILRYNEVCIKVYIFITSLHF